MTTKKTTPSKKGFDCLAYKARVQAKIQADIAGMSPEEEIAYFRHAAETGPFAELWKRISSRKQAA